jgi:cytochrome c-type biogenesis protein CcsB
MQFNILHITFGFYVFSALSFLAGSLSKVKALAAFGRGLLKAGFLMHSVLIGLRWHAAGRPPFANMYEAMVLLGWAIVFVYIIFDFIYKAKILAIPVNILVVLIMLSVLPADSSIKPLMPALQSKWISIHVITYFIGYGAISIAFFMSIIFLKRLKKIAVNDPTMVSLDKLIYHLIIFGFPFLTIGMTTGSTWANVAWGSYWFWDPKETCSLITWLVYAVYLHLRILRGWNNKKGAWLSILGFIATLFTFVGVNYILPGLHSYS